MTSLRAEQPVARQRWWKGAVVVVTTLVVWGSIDAIGDLTQDRPSIYDPTQATIVDLEFSFRRATPDAVGATETLWATCRETIPNHIRVIDLVSTGPSSARLAITPALGEHAVRRFRGCLSDFNLNRTIVGVSDLRHVPLEPALP